MFSYFSPSARQLRALARSLEPRHHDAMQLTQLREVLIARHAELPSGTLGKILDKAKAAALANSDDSQTALLQDTHYSAERALANRIRAS